MENKVLIKLFFFNLNLIKKINLKMNNYYYFDYKKRSMIKIYCNS